MCLETRCTLMYIAQSQQWQITSHLTSVILRDRIHKSVFHIEKIMVPLSGIRRFVGEGLHPSGYGPEYLINRCGYSPASHISHSMHSTRFLQWLSENTSRKEMVREQQFQVIHRSVFVYGCTCSLDCQFEFRTRRDRGWHFSLFTSVASAINQNQSLFTTY